MDTALVKFKDYLYADKKERASIKASDLDDNFARTTVAATEIITPRYTQTGVELTFLAGDREVKWIEIDICVNGVAKKMKVLGTDPYDP